MPLVSSRSFWPLVVGPALAACGPPPAPSQAAAEAKGRCGAAIPEPRADAPLEPLNAHDFLGLDQRQAYVAPFVGFFALARPPSAPREGGGYPVEFRLSARPVASVGQALGVNLAVYNRSRGPVTLLRPLDDGDVHWRYPHYDLYLRHEGSNQTFAFATKGGGLCSRVNAFAPDDYFELAPGEGASVPVFHWTDYDGEVRLRRPGRYVLWAVYRFCGFGVSTERGYPGIEQADAFKRRDALVGEFASNPIAIDVR